MMIRSIFVSALTWLTALPFGASAHPQEPEFDPYFNLVHVPPNQNIGLALTEFPRKDTLFQLRMKDDHTVESCRARFVKKDSPVAIQGCEMLIRRFSLPTSESKKRRNIRLNFVWPKMTVTSYESDFGGAIPLLLNNWISKGEIRRSAVHTYNSQRYEFVLDSEIGADGRASNCSIDNEDMSSDLRALVCQQFVDHSFWIPAFDESAGLIPTRISLHSEIKIGPMSCYEDKGVSLNTKTGVFRWAMMEDDPQCLPDFKDFVGPAVN